MTEERIKPHVHRAPPTDRPVIMTQGQETWEEPEFLAVVHDAHHDHAGTVTNGSLLCLASGTVRGPDATDAQILEAVLGDEHVYSEPK